MPAAPGGSSWWSERRRSWRIWRKASAGSTTTRSLWRTPAPRPRTESTAQSTRSSSSTGRSCRGGSPSSWSTKPSGSSPGRGAPMATHIETTHRQVVLLEDAHIRPMMGLEVLEALPSRHIPYSLVDPYILVHEAVVPNTAERAGLETKHPHRGFDNLWYAISGSSSTGHSTGPGGTMERARLETGSLLKLRTGRGVWHADTVGADELAEGRAGTQMRGLLFWVNLARKD